MRWRVSILKRIQTGVGALNDPQFSWELIRTVWAQKLHKSEDEAYAADQRYAVRLVTFRFHWFDDITEVDRLRCDGVQYNIKGLRELGFREGLEVTAESQS